MKKKIVVFSGAGLDRESGILTFRDCKDGMWNNYKIDEVATPPSLE
jgi:NAD-dependent deacetylase